MIAPLVTCSATSHLLRLHVAGFAAFQAVVQAILAETHVVPALTHAAVPIALAAILFLLADDAFEWIGHGLLSHRLG